MIGDTLVITDYHRAAAERVAPLLLKRLLEGASPLAVSIAGESGSGKSEIAACLAERIEASQHRCLTLCQDDYFRLPPISNHKRRLQDITWVGTGEVRLDLLTAHVLSLKDPVDRGIRKPLVDFAADAIGEEQINAQGCQVILVEGTYTTLVGHVDLRVFINRTYHQTKQNRARRARDPDSEFVEQVLEIEHRIIEPHRDLADVVIPPPPEEAEGSSAAHDSSVSR